jgi:anti-sigma B factor antagonist
MHMTLKMESRVTDGVTVISCSGRIVFGDESGALREYLKKTLNASRQIVLNLSGVTYLDSGGLGTLVGVYSSARANGADIKSMTANRRPSPRFARGLPERDPRIAVASRELDEHSSHS